MRVDGLPLDRARPHERDLDGEVVDRLRLRAEEALHLRTALDLEHPDRVRGLDLGEHLFVVERDAERSIGAPCSRAIRSTHSSMHEHSEPEQVDLEEACVEQESLSHWQSCRPAIAAGWTGTSSTSGRDEMTIPPGSLRDVPRQPGDLAGEELERAPPLERSFCSASGSCPTSSATPCAFQPSVTRASRSSSA